MRDVDLGVVDGEEGGKSESLRGGGCSVSGWGEACRKRAGGSRQRPRTPSRSSAAAATNSIGAEGRSFWSSLSGVRELVEQLRRSGIVRARLQIEGDFKLA